MFPKYTCIWLWDFLRASSLVCNSLVSFVARFFQWFRSALRRAISTFLSDSLSSASCNWHLRLDNSDLHVKVCTWLSGLVYGAIHWIVDVSMFSNIHTHDHKLHTFIHDIGGDLTVSLNISSIATDNRVYIDIFI